ncbi:hypothetical protein ASPVEDRAFT_837388 [Aspergillus versicolor CBS 583.65]|uniref:Transmembrane protein n=1 Tax=Aspergillus versicolor CBS 583.65 TaxID=1036611 RepID=A0A1L9PUV6_ASPVE|nr:uncharacterized protein ASPVEDRAFT_837388 [Aspergillus versicolor CBS 583.65]OJJ05253.1 hypothetical protein ASPVEDRAFT_837388 [Aspergillus versicolor CBS 583.65]
MSCRPIDCSAAGLSDLHLEPDPDISGIGVLAASLGTAWLTLVCLAVHYVAVQVEPSSNLLDSSLQGAVRRALRWNSSRDWSRPLRTLILAISDQQLVTGLAMLIGAFSQLNCGISFYHWQVATTLAWFASITHLATLPFLQEFLQSHKLLLCLRVMLMSGVAIMLAIALLRSGDRDAPAMCGSVANGSDPVGDWISQDGVYTILSEVILLGTLVTRLLRMLSHTSHVGMRILRVVRAKWLASIVWLCKRLQARSKFTAAFTLWVPVLSLSVLVSVQALLDFWRSRTWELLWLLFSLIWGTMRLFTVRYSMQSSRDMLEESYWGFGQVIPVLLLLVPGLVVVESLSEVSSGKAPDIPTQYENLQLLELRDGQQAQSTPSPQSNPPAPLRAMSCIRPTQSEGDRVYDIIIAACERDFRSCPWYLDNLYFMISFIVGAAPVYLLFAEEDFQHLNLFFVQYACLLLGGCCLCLSTIPLCGVVNTIKSNQSKHYACSAIRIVIDPGKAYRICRQIYYYASPALVVLSVIATDKMWILILGYPGIFLAVCTWIVFYMSPFLLSVFGAIYSLYWHAS